MSINIWSILVAALVSFGIGSVWYSPIAFGKQWMALINMSAKNISDAKAQGIWKLYIIQFLLTVLTVCVLAFGIAAMNITSAFNGATLGFLVWIGFYATMAAGGILWENKPLKLALIGGGAMLLNLLVSGAIIGGWN
jgi:hypothetical protein